MKRPLFVIASLVLCKWLMTAYGGGMVGMWFKEHGEVAFALAGLMGHLVGTGVEYLFCRTRCKGTSPRPVSWDTVKG